MRWFWRLFSAQPQVEPEPEMSIEYLIAGLGNPGRKYRGTRHNIGFMAVDRLAQSYGMASDRVEQRAIVGKLQIGSHGVIIAKPQTFMNSSGDSVGPLANYYKIPPENVLIVYDELDLPFGSLRIRGKGGAGGHNGMRSIINHLGQEFPRMRLGIGRPPGKMPASAFVLQPFKGKEVAIVDEMLDDAVKAIETYIKDGVQLAMTNHNRRPQPEE